MAEATAQLKAREAEKIEKVSSVRSVTQTNNDGIEIAMFFVTCANF